MLKSGTTTFLEAGTIRFLDEVVDGLVEVGIRGRVGRWVWDLPPEPDVYRQTTDEAIGHLERQLTDLRSRRRRTDRHVVDPRRPHDVLRPAVAGGAAQLANEHDVGMSFHMSPAKLDPDGFIAEFGQRPMIHLDQLGVLAPDVAMTHCVHVDDEEIDAMAARARCRSPTARRRRSRSATA